MLFKSLRPLPHKKLYDLTKLPCPYQKRLDRMIVQAVEQAKTQTKH